MRVDYVHAGSATDEVFALDGVALEGDWAGPPRRSLDDTNLGKYFFEVIDRKTNRVVYSRGFASIYGEWESTPEAKEGRRELSRVGPLPGAGRSGPARAQEARSAECVPRGVVGGDRPGPPGRRPCGAAGERPRSGR